MNLFGEIALKNHNICDTLLNSINSGALRRVYYCFYVLPYGKINAFS